MFVFLQNCKRRFSHHKSLAYYEFKVSELKLFEFLGVVTNINLTETSKPKKQKRENTKK